MLSTDVEYNGQVIMRKTMREQVRLMFMTIPYVTERTRDALREAKLEIRRE